MGTHPWPRLTMQDHPSECLHPSPTAPLDNRRPWTTKCQPYSSHLGSWLTYTWQKLEELPILANLSQLFTWGPPGFGLWFMYVHYLSRECCYQNPGFPYLLFLCRHHCWVMHPQPYRLLSVFSWWFRPIYCALEQWVKVQNFTSTWKLINCTWVNYPNKLVFIYFDVCATVAENRGPWGNCQGLA
jgi:hypothetical protein